MFSTINNNLNIGQTTVADSIYTKSGAIEEREVDMENEERSSWQAKHRTHKETEYDIKLVSSG